jgi:hypothetical protein
VEEITTRLLTVAGIFAAAFGSAVVLRRGRALRRRPFRPTNLLPGLHLFSSEACPSCARARSVLEDSGQTFFEHRYESGERTLQANSIDRVPTVAWVPDCDGEGWMAEGVPGARRLARWLGP